MMQFHEFAVNNIYDMMSDEGDSKSEIYSLRVKKNYYLKWTTNGPTESWQISPASLMTQIATGPTVVNAVQNTFRDILPALPSPRSGGWIRADGSIIQESTPMLRNMR